MSRDNHDTHERLAVYALILALMGWIAWVIVEGIGGEIILPACHLDRSASASPINGARA